MTNLEKDLGEQERDCPFGEILLALIIMFMGILFYQFIVKGESVEEYCLKNKGDYLKENNQCYFNGTFFNTIKGIEKEKFHVDNNIQKEEEDIYFPVIK